MKEGVLTCPKCSTKQRKEIPLNACVPFFLCNSCKETIVAKDVDCCVFCSYSDRQCPLKSVEHKVVTQ